MERRSQAVTSILQHVKQVGGGGGGQRMTESTQVEEGWRRLLCCYCNYVCQSSAHLLHKQPQCRACRPVCSCHLHKWFDVCEELISLCCTSLEGRKKKKKASHGRPFYWSNLGHRAYGHAMAFPNTPGRPSAQKAAAVRSEEQNRLRLCSLGFLSLLHFSRVVLSDGALTSRAASTLSVKAFIAGSAAVEVTLGGWGGG